MLYIKNWISAHQCWNWRLAFLFVRFVREIESFRLWQMTEKKDANATRARTAPASSRWPADERARRCNATGRSSPRCKPAIIRWSNYHKKGSNFTQCSLFFSSQSGPRLATIGRVARGRQWRLGKVARTDRLSRFLNKFSMIFEGTKLVLPIRPLRVLYDKNLIRKDETFKVFAGDQLFIRCGRSAPCVTLFAFYTCSLRHKTTPFSAKSIRRNHGWTILTI